MSRPFTDVIGEIDRGRLFDELTERLAEVVDGVRLTQKAGELTLKLKISPNGEDAVAIADEVKVKLPEPNKPKSLFFIGKGNALSRRDPRQQDLPLRDVSGPEPDTAKEV